MRVRANIAAIVVLVVGVGTTPAHAAPPTEQNACVQAGDNCIKNIGDVTACRAAQASCLAMEQVINPEGTSGPTRKGRHRAVRAMANLPPLDPKGETPGDPLDPVMQSCELTARDLIVTRLNGEIGRILITRHPRLGMVWRADATTTSADGAYPQRIVCSRHAILLSPRLTVDGETPPLPTG